VLGESVKRADKAGHLFPAFLFEFQAKNAFQIKSGKKQFYLEQNKSLCRYISNNRLLYCQARQSQMFEDKILIWKFKRGGKDAFRPIYDKYAGDLLTLAANLLDDKNDAEDVVQDVFISFVESIESFRLTGSLKGYLATCVANRSRDYFRKNKRRLAAAENRPEQNATNVKTPLGLAMRSEELLKLSHALTELPYEQREILILRLHGDLRFRQIARMQNVSIKTVQSRYRYGLEKLRSALNGEVKK